MIRFEQVAKRYPNGHVGLHELTFRVRPGEFLFVTGHSGAGKSTLLRLLLAMERPTSGKLLLAGQDLSTITNAQIPFLRRQIGVVFQNHQLLFDRTVYDNVALPLQILGLSKPEIAKRVGAALERVSLSDKAAQAPGDLSTGQQQRVGIARAIVHRPALLLADEPTGNLDPRLAAEIMGVFEDINQLGTTVLIASHDLALTKLDGTAKGGVIFALAKQFGLPIRYIGVGEGIDDLRPFEAQAFVQALFEERERA